MKYRCPLVVREIPDAESTGIERNSRVNFSDCENCSSIGQCQMRVSLAKDCLSSHDELEANIDVDNSECETDVEKVTLKLVKLVTLKATESDYQTTYVVLEKDFSGVEAHRLLENTSVTLNLSEAKQHGHKHHFWPKKHLNHDDLLHAEHIQPTSEGDCISITYELEVKCIMASTCCKSKGPVCRIPVTIQSPFLPTASKLQIPESWDPTVHSECRILLPGRRHSSMSLDSYEKAKNNSTKVVPTPLLVSSRNIASLEDKSDGKESSPASKTVEEEKS